MKRCHHLSPLTRHLSDLFGLGPLKEVSGASRFSCPGEAGGFNSSYHSF